MQRGGRAISLIAIPGKSSFTRLLVPPPASSLVCPPSSCLGRFSTTRRGLSARSPLPTRLRSSLLHALSRESALRGLLARRVRRPETFLLLTPAVPPPVRTT